MPEVTLPQTTTPTIDSEQLSAGDQLEALGWHINAHQYQAVHLAADYDLEHEWFHQGLPSAAAGIAHRLQIHASTAREWIRVGHCLRHLPSTDAAFATNQISYAKARILTRWADDDNETQLLDLANEHTANRLTTEIAKLLAQDDPNEEKRDQQHHDDRSLTSYTNGDGMVVIRVVLPPAIAKLILTIINTLVRRIAKTPLRPPTNAADPSADASDELTVTNDPTHRDQDPPADTPTPPPATALGNTLEELRQRWQPGADDDWLFPTMAQQRADAFAAFFCGLDVQLTTEVVIHLRSDGNTFDDGTPLTTNAITKQLPHSYLRLMLHDVERSALDATNKRRHPTARQKRVVLETHNHQCVDCGTTEHLELDHNPPFQQTGHTITTELEPRCTPCHRARHRRGG